MRAPMWLAALACAARLAAGETVPAGVDAAGVINVDAPATKPAPATATPRIVAIGDLHGDYDKTVEVLQEAGVMDDALTWVGGDTIVVQTGDVTDRGDGMNEIIMLLEKLKPEAAAAGGELVTLLGNHEVMNLMGQVRYVHPKTIQAAGGYREHIADYDPRTGKIGKILMEYPIAVERGGTIFVHAGLRPEIAAMGLEAITAHAHDDIVHGRWDSPLLGNTGPVWLRDQVFAAENGDCSTVTAALAAFPSSPKRLVVGHTIQPGGAISALCDGAFFAIDVALSTFIARRDYLAYLEIVDGRARVMGRGAAAVGDSEEL